MKDDLIFFLVLQTLKEYGLIWIDFEPDKKIHSTEVG